MIQVLTKPSEQISIDDVKSLIVNNVPENERIEFKRSLPSEENTSDSWNNVKSQIGKYARNKILEETVAFANAFGGALILGIEETDAKPPAAANICSIPNCADLAERLKLIFRDCIEPELPNIEIFAVRTNGERGVVILRTGRSFRAPHRVKPTGVCPIRRSDRCEKLNMREIQDLTLNLNRGIEGLKQKLLDRSTSFKKKHFHQPTSYLNAFGLRMTAIPVLDEVQLNTVYQQGRFIEQLSPPIVEVQRRIGNTTISLVTLLNVLNSAPSSWRPMLRAACADVCNSITPGITLFSYSEVSCDGLLEIQFVSMQESIHRYQSNGPWTLNSDIPVSMFAGIVEWVEKVRKQAHAVTAEYVIEIEITATDDKAKVEFGAPSYDITPATTLPIGTKVFPQYPFVHVDDKVSIVALFERDLWNFLGRDLGDNQGCLSF